MRAVVLDRYGPPEVLRLEEVERPAPEPGVGLRTTSTRTDCGRNRRVGIVRYAKEDALALERLLAEGEYRPVIDCTYRLEDVVEAQRYIESHRKTGPVVLSLNGGPR